MQIGIIGYGVHGRHIEAMALETYPQALIIVFDDLAVDRGLANAHPFADWKLNSFAQTQFLVALGYHYLPLRVQIIRQLLDMGRQVPALVHPSAHVSPHSRLGAGTIVAPMSTVAPFTALEEGVYLGIAVTVSHDVKIGAGCHAGPAAVFCGGSQVGPYTFIGANSTISNGRCIGRECRIGIASVITQDVPDGKSVIGSPMRILDKTLQL